MAEAPWPSESESLLPIRMIESWAYCPAQAWYRFVAGDDPVNAAMARGLRRHASLDEVPGTSRFGGTVYRHLAVRAPRLSVQGVVDEVEIAPGVLAVTEYKSASLPRLVWSGVMLQVALQWLALAEQLGATSSRADLRVYFTESRRYRTIAAHPALFEKARNAVIALQEIMTLESPPPGLIGPRCDTCQHAPICMPDTLPLLVEAAR